MSQGIRFDHSKEKVSVPTELKDKVSVPTESKDKVSVPTELKVKVAAINEGKGKCATPDEQKDSITASNEAKDKVSKTKGTGKVSATNEPEKGKDLKKISCDSSMPNKSTKEHSTVQPLPSEKKGKQLAASKNTQPQVPSESTEPIESSPNDKEETQVPNLEDMLKDDSADSLVVLFRYRNTLVSRNGQYSKFTNEYNYPTCCYERLVADLANQNEVFVTYCFPLCREIITLLSPPVLMHGGLLCATFRLSICLSLTIPKVTR